jgi:hypothetical protein
MSPPPRCRRRGRDRKRRPPRSSGAWPRLSRRPSSRGPKGRGYHELQALPAGVGGSERPLGDVHSWDGYVASVYSLTGLSSSVASLRRVYSSTTAKRFRSSSWRTSPRPHLSYATSPRRRGPCCLGPAPWCAPLATSGLLPLHSHPFKRGRGGSGSSSKVGVGAREKWG